MPVHLVWKTLCSVNLLCTGFPVFKFFDISVQHEHTFLYKQKLYK